MSVVEIKSGTGMYVRPEQLKANLEAMDSESIRAKVRSGRLTAEALEVANAVLAARGEAVQAGSHMVPSRPKTAPNLTRRANLRGWSIALVAFYSYLAFAVLCAVVVFADPPWATPSNGTWAGMLGGIASLAAGLPWTYLYLKTVGATAGGAALATVAGLGVSVNVVLFIGYLGRASGEPLR